MRAFWVMVTGMVILALFAGVTNMTAADERKIKGEIQTSYGTDGRPTNQGKETKGWHRIVGSVKLVAGTATITLNTSTADGKHDISFITDSTYSGRAWSVSQSNDSTYKVIPISGTQFIVKSSGGTDTATVRFIVEGE